MRGQHRGHRRCGNSAAPLELEEELAASRSGAKPFLLVFLLRLLLLILGRTRDSVVEGGVFGLPFLDPDAVPPAVKPLPPQRSRRGRLNRAWLSGRTRSSLSVGALGLSPAY